MTDKVDLNLQRIVLHESFWNGAGQAYPIAAIRVEKDFFFARHFAAASCLLVPGKLITPDMIDVDSFLPDYERMYLASERLGQDAFFVAEPYTGIPWMEAIVGCEICGEENSFVSKPWVKSLDQTENIDFNPHNPWLKKYLEFTDKLTELSAGRFPVGMPIMRGPSDIAGALLGQTEMVFTMADEPEGMSALLMRLAHIFLQVQAEQRKRILPFYGGYSLGFYHVWCPDECIWFQDDLSALLSPGIYKEFLSSPARLICRDFKYTCFHLHPASFFILDELMANKDLRAIQVNKDDGGPSVREMLPELKRIQSAKNLILFGNLDQDDIVCLKENLPAQNLFLQIITDDDHAARSMIDMIRNW